MRIERHFTTAGEDPFDSVEWATRSSSVRNIDGSLVSEMAGVEVPAQWSQMATDIVVTKYFRKAGVPDKTVAEPVDLNRVATSTELPEWLRPHLPAKDAVFGPETSVRQVVHRLAGCWAFWGFTNGYFDPSAEDTGWRYQQLSNDNSAIDPALVEAELREDNAKAFYDEVVYMLLHQMAAPNSPQWFNTGLAWAYGITGQAQGHWYVDDAAYRDMMSIVSNDAWDRDSLVKAGVLRQAADNYTRPQPHACFIQGVKDDLVNPGGIFDLWLREARVFKMGGGSGSNFSAIRGANEKLSGGGKSSGLMSWLRIGDRAAGAIKSGGTTRRAAKMVCLDVDHPDVMEFIDLKTYEEMKVEALVKGQDLLTGWRKDLRDRIGLKLDYDFNGDAYATVWGQNANNTIRIPQAFWEALEEGGEWQTRYRTTGKVANTYKAQAIWDRICLNAWASADPGIHYSTTINDWNTCANSGPINASNPCSEYLFLDDTACNLASLNLATFLSDDTSSKTPFDIEKYEHAVRLWTVVLDISVTMSSLPSPEIALGTYRFRTLGLGYANLGALLMRLGIPYDSGEGRHWAGALTAMLTGTSYHTSAALAAELKPFPGYRENEASMLRVIRNHRRAAWAAKFSGEDRPDGIGDYEGLSVLPTELEDADPADLMLDRLVTAARISWDRALEEGVKHGYRNAQTTVLAPTGTIGLLMDCDTTGVEPDFALVKMKKLAGGGVISIVNESMRPALLRLGYSASETEAILQYVLEAFKPKPKKGQPETPEEFWPRRGHVEGAPHLKPEHYAVFDCASKARDKAATRYIVVDGHIHMMAATQPFLSGAQSKTINLPATATIEDIDQAYRESHDLGLKAVALYRDGCKLSQPLNTSGEDEEEAKAPLGPPLAVRHRLPIERAAINKKFDVAGVDGYITVGVYPDGSPGEIFISISKEGSTIAGLMDCFATSVSLALQHGVPLAKLVEKFSHQRFEPSGMTIDPDIPFAKSIIDYLFRWMGMRFIPGFHELHAPARGGASPVPPPTLPFRRQITQHDKDLLERMQIKKQLEEVNCEGCGDAPIIQ